MEKILIIRLGAIGDVVLTSPAVLNLKLSFPEAKIFFLVRRRLAGLLELFAGVDEILGFPENAGFRDLFRMGEYLDTFGFDMVVDLHGNIRSKYLRSHIVAPIKVQYSKRRFERWQAIRFNKINPAPPHTIDLYNSAVERCGGRVFARRPILHLDRREHRRLAFDNPLRVIAIGPGASFPPKKWPADRFRSLAIQGFEQIPANIVLLLTENEREMAGIGSTIPGDRLRIFIDADLKELAGIISESDVLVCNDSALAHIGSAVGTPVIAIFGPTHPTLGFSPRGMKDIVVQVDEFCRPCSLHGNRPCYRGRQYCFDRISVDDVLGRVVELLKNKAGGDRAIFVDRDGTLIREKGYLRDPAEVEPEERAIEAVKLAGEKGFKVIVVTNQSGVARGYFGEEDVHRVNRRVVQIFDDARARIDDILYCPYHPDGVVDTFARWSDCRKPAPGMIEEACRRHNINAHKSYVIGDVLSDINLAYVIGGTGILVQTGYGAGQMQRLENSGAVQPEMVVKNFFEAVKYIADSE